MAYGQAMLIALTVSLLLYLNKVPLIRLFMEEESIKESTEDIYELSVRVIPLFCLTNIVDMNLSFFLGCVRALGTQASVALVTLACFYLLSIPFACFFAFGRGTGIAGLWLGYFLGIMVLMVIVAWMTLREEWQDIADAAANRIVNNYHETISLLPDLGQSQHDVSVFSFLDGIERDQINNDDDEKKSLLMNSERLMI